MATTDVNAVFKEVADLKEMNENVQIKLKTWWRQQNKSSVVAEVIKECLGVCLIVPGKTRWNSEYDAIAQVNYYTLFFFLLINIQTVTDLQHHRSFTRKVEHHNRTNRAAEIVIVRGGVHKRICVGDATHCVHIGHFTARKVYVHGILAPIHLWSVAVIGSKAKQRWKTIKALHFTIGSSNIIHQIR